MKAVNVAITGCAGQIGYALAFRVAAGGVFGPDTRVNLHLLEITPALGALQGIVMELDDCAFATLGRVVATDDARVAFRDCEAAFLVGARPSSRRGAPHPLPRPPRPRSTRYAPGFTARARATG